MAKRVKLMWEGLKLQCPACGEKEVTIHLALDTMTCRCESCDDSFSAETARSKIAEQLAKWDAMCRWIASARQVLTSVQSDCDAYPPVDPEYADDVDSEIVAKVFA